MASSSFAGGAAGLTLHGLLRACGTSTRWALAVMGLATIIGSYCENASANPSSPVSSSAHAAPVEVFKTPDRLVVVQSKDKSAVVLRWRDRSSSEASFRIERERFERKRWRSKPSITVAANVTSYVDRLSAVGSYRYCVRALKRRRATSCSSKVALRIDSLLPPSVSQPLSSNVSSISISSSEDSSVSTSLSSSSESANNTAASSLPISSSSVTSSSESSISGSTSSISSSSSSNSSYDPYSISGNYQEPQALREGWTDLTPSADSRIIYVSASIGNDQNLGTSPEAPVRTIRKAHSLLRNGYPDQMRLRRGDTWYGEVLGPVDYNNAQEEWGKSGRSSVEPMVIGAYGSGPRPKLVLRGEQYGFYTIAGVSNLVIADLHLDNERSDWWGGGIGISSIGPTQNFTVEGCLIEHFGYNLNFTSYAGVPRNIWIRRNVIADAWQAVGHSQGIFVSVTDDFYIDENIFINNGWKRGAVDVGLTSATYDATTRILRQPGGFPSSRYAAYHPGDTIEISGGQLATGTAISYAGTTNRLFRGNAELSPVDNFYRGKTITFTSGANSGTDRTRKAVIVDYVGATREFTIHWATNFAPPEPGDTFKVEVAGLYPLEERLSDSEVRLASPGLVPVSLPNGDITSDIGFSATIFNRTAYISNGFVTARLNIDIDGASGGFQHRKGGISWGNVVVRAPLAITFGHAQNGTSVVRGRINDNVILGARDIERQPRGFGISVSGNRVVAPYGVPGNIVPAIGVRVENNIISGNKEGTGNMFPLTLGNYVRDVQFKNNIVYDWTNGPANLPSAERNRGTGFRKELGGSAVDNFVLDCLVESNAFVQIHPAMVANFEDLANLWPGLSLRRNLYSTPRAANQWFGINTSSPYAQSLSFASWAAAVGEQDSMATNLTNYPDPGRNIERYIDALEMGTTIEDFIAMTRIQSKDLWDERFTARAINNYVREGFGMDLLEE